MATLCEVRSETLLAYLSRRAAPPPSAEACTGEGAVDTVVMDVLSFVKNPPALSRQTFRGRGVFLFRLRPVLSAERGRIPHRLARPRETAKKRAPPLALKMMSEQPKQRATEAPRAGRSLVGAPPSGAAAPAPAWGSYPRPAADAKASSVQGKSVTRTYRFVRLAGRLLFLCGKKSFCRSGRLSHGITPLLACPSRPMRLRGF